MYSKVSNKPLWARVNVKNVFSRFSIEKLLKKCGLEVIDIKIDNFNKGKVFVFATRSK